MKLLLTLIVLLFASLVAIAQNVMTNDDVVAMVKAGLSAEIINAKIRSSATKFDTSTEALVKLSEAKVPDAVVVAMVEQAQKDSEKRESAAKSNQSALDSVPEQGNLSDLVGKKKVFVSSQFLKARDNIVKELTKDGTFTVVDKVEDSDFVITYYEETRVRNVVATANTNGNSTTASARENKENVGQIRVMMPSTTPGASRLRLLYESTKVEFWLWDDSPSKSTTKQFLKDFKKVKPKQ